MRTIYWDDGIVVTIDQSRLPQKLVHLRLKDCKEVAKIIKEMKVRGAPLIGVTAGFGLALTAYNSKARSREELIKELEASTGLLRSTRPTAVNLFWAVDRVLRTAHVTKGPVGHVSNAVVEEAIKMAEEDVEINKAIGRNGAKLLDDGDAVLTHCNAGSLATVGYGTALGVVRAAVEEGKKISVIATETRPKQQGARLTTFELERDGIPVTLICDTMVGHVMQKELVDKVVVGADRILKTGHVINKIGTYQIAVLAKTHNIPFYSAAPTSTFDLKTEVKDVVIEERAQDEVLKIFGKSIAARGVKALNPAFDITPPEYVSLIICEKGCVVPEEAANVV
ncbi:MAG: S-methyl-5-thioribose-1-phosphate isomerase [Candidatus Bathyarchaeota archaeon]|nr:S-methyl-5-thioribose-1-phosphate isomerase [Candidatus Bathyarchaeota archaeon]